MSARRIVRAGVPLLLCSSLTGCAFLMHRSAAESYSVPDYRVAASTQRGAVRTAARAASGPWESGVGIRLAPGFPLGSNQAFSAHPTVSYSYLSFDGGHDALYEVGGQLRWRPRPQQKNGGLWVGGEVAAARLSTSIDGALNNTSNNGWSLTGLIGAPVGSSRWGVNLYGAAGISNYGTRGTNLRVGVDLQPWFLKRSK
jgi:hypothetical protein